MADRCGSREEGRRDMRMILRGYVLQIPSEAREPYRDQKLQGLSATNLETLFLGKLRKKFENQYSIEGNRVPRCARDFGKHESTYLQISASAVATAGGRLPGPTRQ